MPIYSQLPDVSDIDQRLQKLQDSGMLVSNDESIVNKKLNDLAKEVKLGQAAIYGNGKLLIELTRTVENKIIRTFP